MSETGNAVGGGIVTVEDYEKEGFGRDFIPEVTASGVNLTVNPEAASFSCTEPGATEFEFLRLLSALVGIFKPTLLVETGTWTATGAVAMLRGAESGAHLVTINDVALRPDAVEILEAEAAKRGCSWELVQANTNDIDAAKWAEMLKGKCTFAFLDSSIADRHGEFGCLSDPVNGILDLSRPCCVVVHDMSNHRPPYESGASDLPVAVAALKGYANSRGWSLTHIHQSRGVIVLMRYPGIEPSQAA